MKRLFITLLVYLLTNGYQLKSQTSYSVDKWMEYLEQLALETDDEARIEALYADLSQLSEQPFELNTVSEEQLRRLPFLSDGQISNLLNYRIRYGKLVSIYELKNIDSFDFETISLLLPFVYIAELTVDKRPITVNNLLKYGSNELLIRYDACFQQKKGYCSYPDSVIGQYPNRKYTGEPFYHSLRYSYAYDERIQFGFVAEKDAGEPFWNAHHKGYDYYAAHLFLKDMNRWLKTLAIGDYKMSFGQGLVVSNDFTPSRSATVSQAERRSNGFRRHYSTNETDYFRGMAATLSLNKFDISLFYSFRRLDAGTDSNQVRSFKTDGLHRLVRDREKMHAVPMQAYGGNIRYATPNLCIGITALSYSFGRFTVSPEPQPYNLFYFRGSNHTNIGVDYLLKNSKVKLYGETALSANGAFATLNALQLTPASYFSFLLLHRYYDRRYQSFFGNAFSQGSTVQNEQGLYLAMQCTPVAGWKLSAYADVFRFPWLKYGIDAPSAGKEGMVQVDHVHNKQLSVYFRYKYKQKEQNETSGSGGSLRVAPYTQHRMRLQLQYAVSAVVSLRTSADGVCYREVGEKGQGWMISQSMGWKPVHIPFQTDLYAAFFHTANSSCRISSYEKNILYAFTMPSFYGEGVRTSCTFKWKLSRQLALSAKWACTWYADRDVIGTDLEAIDGSVKMDLYALLRWKF